MSRKLMFVLLSALVVGSILLTACQPQTVTVTVVQTVPPVKETVVATPTPLPPTEVVYPRNETLYISGAAWGPPSTWNPFQPGMLANTTGTIGLLYELLFHYDPLTGKFIPWLAESGKWAGATVYELTLRKGLTWSDGQPLTAADVKFTLELGKKYAALWFSPIWTNTGLKSVEAVDDTRLKFTFQDPLYQEWDNYLYNLPIVPKHLWEGRSEDEVVSGANANPIGSGPYLYVAHAEDRNIWMRNENWWGIRVFGKPAPKYIVDLRFSSNNVALGAVLKGDVDLSNNFLPGIATLVQQGYVKTYYSQAPYMLSANTAVLFLNTTRKPMDDPAFRKALAFAIDVPTIIKTAFADLVKPSSPSGLLPTLSQFDDPEVIAELGYSYDPNKAKEILAQAGYKDVNGDGFVEAPDGSAIKLEVTCPFGWTDWMAAIDVIAKSAQAAGINVQAAYPDYGAWNTALQGGTFDMTLNNWAQMSNTPWTAYNLFFRHPIQEQMQSGNFGRYANQEMFDLVDALARVPTNDIAGMKEACSKIQRLMLTEMPLIPLWYNGLWAQWNEAYWTNWPSESNPVSLPSTWSGYWQMGGLQTLINLKPAQ